MIFVFQAGWGGEANGCKRKARSYPECVGVHRRARLVVIAFEVGSWPSGSPGRNPLHETTDKASLEVVVVRCDRVQRQGLWPRRCSSCRGHEERLTWNRSPGMLGWTG